MYKFNIDFMSVRMAATGLSAVLLLISVISLALQGLTLGPDFTGGSLLELSYKEAPDLDQIRGLLAQAGQDQAIVQYLGSDKQIMIRLAESFNPALGEQFLNLLNQNLGQTAVLNRSEFIGSRVGEDLREQGGLGLLTALGVVLFYIAFRFQIKFALAAVIALVHDVLIVVGFFSFFGWMFDLNVLAAILAVIGYSLNDTIVVFDRIRENFRKLRGEPPIGIINSSLNQTLSRTVATSFTTLLVLFALWFYGGENTKGFASALIIGISFGTYSSIFVASGFLVFFDLQRTDLIPAALEHEPDEGAE